MIPKLWGVYPLSRSHPCLVFSHFATIKGHKHTLAWIRQKLLSAHSQSGKEGSFVSQDHQEPQFLLPSGSVILRALLALVWLKVVLYGHVSIPAQWVTEEQWSIHRYFKRVRPRMCLYHFRSHSTGHNSVTRLAFYLREAERLPEGSKRDCTLGAISNHLGSHLLINRAEVRTQFILLNS